ncbi:MAG: hypothetical protein GXP62_21085 [Oligoflexia bacterium]|nr:hypothetical protein [Oligoflexia bacterium]
MRDPAAFFDALDLRLPVSGLPACQAPRTLLVEPIHRLGAVLFDPDTGRLSIRELAREHIVKGYKCKSVRCADCPVDQRCEGVAINMVRDQGLALCRPLEGTWALDAAAQLVARWPTPPQRVRDGKALEAAHPSLPGFAQPQTAVADPLAVAATALGRRSKPLLRGPSRVKQHPRREG